MQEVAALSWREVVDRHHADLVDELSGVLDSQMRDAACQAATAERAQGRAQVESLNLVLRRLRSAGTEQVLSLLAEGCAPYAEKLVVLVFESNHDSPAGVQAHAAAAAGMAAGNIRFDTALAPAIVAAIESRDPVVALASEVEISPDLAAAFGSVPQAEESLRAYLFPIVARHTVVAMLVALGAEVSASGAQDESFGLSAVQIQLLCEAAGMRLEAIETAARPAPQEQRPREERKSSWESLSAEDQKLHMQAQRMARLRVAEMRLYHEKELKSGTAAGDIYTALRDLIDAARQQFRDAFLSKSPTMVDYLHLEILRSLAHDEERLLGSSYPGPMV